MYYFIPFTSIICPDQNVQSAQVPHFFCFPLQPCCSWQFFFPCTINLWLSVSSSQLKYLRVLCFPVRALCPCLGRGRKCTLDLDLKRLITSCYNALHWHNGAIICKAVTLPHKLHYFPLFFASALLFRYWPFAGEFPWNIINLFSWI